MREYVNIPYYKGYEVDYLMRNRFIVAGAKHRRQDFFRLGLPEQVSLRRTLALWIPMITALFHLLFFQPHLIQTATAVDYVQNRRGR